MNDAPPQRVRRPLGHRTRPFEALPAEILSRFHAARRARGMEQRYIRRIGVTATTNSRDNVNHVSDANLTHRVMRAFSAGLHVGIAVGLHIQLGRIAAGTAVAGLVRCWSAVMLFALTGAAVAMSASLIPSRNTEYATFQRLWDLSLLLRVIGSLGLWAALTTAA